MLKDVRHLIAVFEEDGPASFTIDRVELNLFSRRLGVGPKPRFMPDPAVLTALPRSNQRWQGEHHSISFKCGDLDVRLALGHYKGGKGSLSAVVGGNIHDRLRERLLRGGVLHPSSPPGLRKGRSNFIDGACLLPPAKATDLHHLAIRELWILVHEARQVYRRELARFFGLRLPARDVGASVAQIELSWDRPCRIARAATTIFWPAWRDTFYGATVFHGRDDDDEDGRGVRYTEATEHREEDACPGAGVLRADGVHGAGAKLYAKAHHHLRFEFELSRERATDLLHHSIRLADQRHLRADLGLEPMPTRCCCARRRH